LRVTNCELRVGIFYKNYIFEFELLFFPRFSKFPIACIISFNTSITFDSIINAIPISVEITTFKASFKSAKMKKETIATDLTQLIEDSTVDPRIKRAELLSVPESRLDSQTMKYTPMDDASIPFRNITNPETKKESIYRLIDKLNVELSLRYQRTIEDTYCNVYTFDYCYFSKVYVPTVWWTEEALQKVLNGEEVEAVFGKTVDHIYSSAIHDWFLKWGASFGWKRMFDVEEIQNAVNANGGVGIICAKRKEKGLSGHIVPVVPESDEHKAYRENGKVVYPLQSQAGKLNHNYFTDIKKDWWNDDLYSSHVFYYHD